MADARGEAAALAGPASAPSVSSSAAGAPSSAAAMGPMVGSEHLTEESVSHIMTKPGQAHFARVDTDNTCRECNHWLNQKGERTNAGLLKPAQCRKALSESPPVPHSARACKHFEASLTPPAI